MYYQNRFDSHVHSDCSPDGHDSVICLAEQAVKRDFSGIAITDSCSVDSYERMQYGQRIRESIYSVYKARAAFENKLIITSGIELSQPLSDRMLSEGILSGHDFDLVLCSIKKQPDGSSFSEADFSRYTAGELTDMLEEYYDTMLRTVQWGKFDVLAHISYPVRFLGGYRDPDFSMGPLDDCVQEVLKALVASGKALEINTSGLRHEPGHILPQSRFIKRYRELGGELVTIGSGAHGTDTLGSDITEGMLAASEAGFGNFAFYKQRQPKLLKII